MTTFISDSDTRDAALAGMGLALVWAIAAAIRPSSTFHLAPILIAGSVPFLAKTRDQGGYARATLFGLGIALLASLGLAVLDLLRGPSLLPAGGAFVEAIVFALGGAVVGYLAARSRK